MVLHQTGQMEVQIPKLEAKQMSGLVTPNRITGDMGGLLSDGSDDDAVEGSHREPATNAPLTRPRWTLSRRGDQGSAAAAGPLLRIRI